MTVDVWSRPASCLAAQSVFQLANELPLLRLEPSAAIDEAAAALEPGTRSVPRPVVEELLESLDGEEVERLVRLVEREAPERWRILVVEAGAEAALEPLLVAAASASVIELVPPPRWLAEMRETTADSAPGPINVLAMLVPVESVWSLASARRAERLAFSPRALFAFAEAGLEPWQLERARRIAAPVARILPLEGAPRTTGHLTAALALLGADAGVTELCVQLLVAYALRLAGIAPTLPSCAPFA